jgi:uncharacterized cupin superfamily protein
MATSSPETRLLRITSDILADVLAHWDEVEGSHREKGPMGATWQRLGDAAGAQGFGLNRVRIDPGRLSTPPHSHGRSEEIFFVLGGSGLLWQDGAVCEVRTGDTIVNLPDREEHTLRAGPEGLEYVVFGTRHPNGTREPNDICYYPRSNKVYFRGVGLMTRLEHLEYEDGEPDD